MNIRIFTAMNPIVASKNTVIVSERDAKIVFHVSNGLSSKQIGEKMKISHRTVEERIASLKRTFDCDSISHLVAYFLRKGLIK